VKDVNRACAVTSVQSPVTAAAAAGHVSGVDLPAGCRLHDWQFVRLSNTQPEASSPVSSPLAGVLLKPKVVISFKATVPAV